MRIFMSLLGCWCLLSLLSVTAQANDKIKFVASAAVIHNLKQTMDELKRQSILPVVFPARISSENKDLYASVASTEMNADVNKYWIINIDHTQACHGVHFCHQGALSAQAYGKINKYYRVLPRGIEHKKQEIKILGKYNLYYTPGHAEADWHAPTMEWKIKHTLYTLSWNVPKKQSKMILQKMASSAIAH